MAAWQAREHAVDGAVRLIKEKIENKNNVYQHG